MNITALASIALVATNILTPTTTDSDIAQGDIITYTSLNPATAKIAVNTCTIGYTKNTTAHTAGHCGYPGAEAYNKNGTLIGYFDTVQDKADDYTAHGDTGTINLTKPTNNNPYAQDSLIHLTPKDGDKICIHAGYTDKTLCGTIDQIDDDVITAHGIEDIQPGDSGSPAWIPGKGYVGTLSANVTTKDGDVISALITTAD